MARSQVAVVTAVVSVIAAVVFPLACQKAVPCEQLSVASDSSTGTFTYAYRLTKACGGSGKVEQSLAASAASPGYLSMEASGPGAIDVSGQYNVDIGDTDFGGQVGFDLNAASIAVGTSTKLGSTSQVCFYTDEFDCVGGTTCFNGPTDAGPACECPPVTGTITTTSFSTDCDQGQCALVVVGSMDATATWAGGSFTIHVSLNHQEALQSDQCTTSND